MSNHAKRSLGQNFLSDHSIIEQIVSEVDPRPGETIVEIGPGRGALTEPLVRSGARVIAVELDDALSETLRDEFAGAENFTLVTADALEIDLCDLITPARHVRIVANLPYNISTAILQRFIQQSECVVEMTLMLQREVVDRITARPNDPERGFLSVLVEGHCIAERLLEVPPTAFRPAPKVWSAVARLTMQNSLPADIDEDRFLRLVGAGFAQRRKTILNNLKAAPQLFGGETEAVQAADVLESAGIDPGRRAQSLSLTEWIELNNAIRNIRS
jgi:16S rRNA (adenine1518-N6/adenine1519-N6)-dimethyltransferase